MSTPNDLTSVYVAYREHPDAENTSVLFAHLRAYVGRVVRGWKNRLADPDDVTAQTVASVWASMGSYTGDSAFSTWVHQITRRKIIDAIRKSASAPLMTTDERLMTKAVPISDHPLLEPSSLTALNDDERSLVQRLLECPDYDELAQALCVSRVALIRRLQRILGKCEQDRSKSVVIHD